MGIIRTSPSSVRLAFQAPDCCYAWGEAEFAENAEDAENHENANFLCT